MTHLQAIADFVEIDALRSEFADAATMRDYDRFAALFTPDGAWRMPQADVDLVGRRQIRTAVEHAQEHIWEQSAYRTHPGTIQLVGDTATGRVYVAEFGRMHDGSSQRHCSLYDDRYRRTADGWKFAERVYEIKYLDTGPLTGSPPPRRTA